ncbi:hypothetical protein AAY473_011406 [Plecturocebus cupreus]
MREQEEKMTQQQQKIQQRGQKMREQEQKMTQQQQKIQERGQKMREQEKKMTQQQQKIQDGDRRWGAGAEDDTTAAENTGVGTEDRSRRRR